VEDIRRPRRPRHALHDTGGHGPRRARSPGMRPPRPLPTRSRRHRGTWQHRPRHRLRRPFTRDRDPLSAVRGLFCETAIRTIG
jgi:hypothetical protein